MKTLSILLGCFALAACSQTPGPDAPMSSAPGQAAPSDGDTAATTEPQPPAAATQDSRCPPASDSCMGDDAYAACMEVAATCKGSIVQLESCPLQFACDE